MNNVEDVKGYGELLDDADAERNAEPKFAKSFDRTKIDAGVGRLLPDGVREEVMRRADAMPVSPLAAFKDNTFTPEERKRRQSRILAAQDTLFSSDIERMTPEFAAGFYRAIHKALFDLEDPDGRVAFGSRASDDPKKNLDMLKRFCRGEHQLISSDDKRAWDAMPWEEKFRYALEHETKGNKVASNLEGDRGSTIFELAGAGMPGAQFGNTMLNADAPNKADIIRRTQYDLMTPEEKRKYEADVISDYEERMLKDNRLAAYLELTAGLSDKAKWLVAKGVNDGECDMDALRQLRGAEPERALTAIKMARGNLTHGQILGIDTDFSTGTAGDRLQMGLYGFQQGVIGLFADTYRFLENVGAYGVAKRMYDEKEFREFSDAMSFRAKFDQAFTQDLPEPESFMGEAYQGVMENLHWGLSWETSAFGKGLMASATGIARPTLGATLKALAAKPSAWKGVIAEYGKTFKLMPNAKLADMGKGLKAAEADFARKQMRYLGKMIAARSEGKETAQLVNPFVGEYLTRQAAAVDRLRKNYDAARRIAMLTDGLGAGLATTGSMASFATFAQEYMDNAVAAGVDWDDALVTAVGVGLINAKIENIWIPGVEGGLTRDEIGKLTWASFKQALANTVAKNGKRGLKDYFAIWARKYAASAGRAAFEEGIIEEPLQQIVIEHGIEFDKILKEYGYTGPTQVLKAFLPTADDWKTFVDTAIEMLPNDFGFALTSLPMAVGRQSRNQAVHNLWAKKWHYWRDEQKRRRDWVADHGSLDDYKPAPMPTMYTATGELSPEMVKGDYSKVTDLDYGVVDMIQNEINLQQLVKDEWTGEDKGSVSEDPKKERGTRLKVAEKIQVARDAWKANDGTGDVVGTVADALGVGRRTAEVACSVFEAESGFADFNAKARTVLNANFVLASLTEADLKEINPNIVDGSFERDERTGSVKAEILIDMGKDENGKDREPVRKTVVYRIGSSVLSEEDIPVAAARGSKFGDSWIGTRKGEIVHGRRVETWDELMDDERLELVKRDRWIAKGSAGPGATVEFTDKDGNVKKIDADFLVSFATGRIGDIGYGTAAKRSTMFHENFHVLWDSIKEFIPEEDRKNLAKKLDVDVEKGDWDSRLQEKMAIQLEAYSGGQMVPQFSQNVIEGMQDGIRGALGGLLDMMMPRTINPETGKEYELRDFYDAVLRGDIGNAAELLKAATGKMPEKDGGTKPSEGKLPGSVTAEELAAKDAETAKDGENEAKSKEVSVEAETSQPQPSQPTVRRPSWDHGDRIDRKCPGRKWKLKCKLVLMSVHDLVTQQAQGRDVTAKDYKDRVDEMARTWEIEEGTKIDNTVLLGVPTAFTKDVVPGAVDKSVFAGNTRTSAILKIYENGGDTADAFRASQEQLAEERGIERADGWENDPVVIALLEEVEVPGSEKVPTAQEIADASNGNIASAYGASESAGAHATILIANNLIPLFQIDLKTGEIVDNDEAYRTSRVNPIGEFYRKAGGNKALPDFYRKDTTNLSDDGQRILRNAILSALFGGRGGDTVARLMSEADRLGMQNEMAALMQLAPELLSLANDREHVKYDLRGPLVEALRWVQRWLDADEAARKSAGKTHAEWKRRKDGKPVEPAALATTWENFREGDMTEKPSEEAVILGDLLAAAHQTLAWFQDGEGGEERPSEASKLTARRLVTGYVRDYLENVRHATAPVEDGLFGGTEDAAAFAPPTTAEILRTQRGTRFSVAMSSAIESLVDPRVANSVTEAGETLKASGAVNRPLTNQILGLTAKITGNGLSKMTSEKATKKSRSPYLHALAVANADKIFECAFSDATHPDSHGRKEVLQVHRLGSMLYDPQAKRFEPVLVTMIEYKRDGENIYTLEAIDVDAYQKKNSAGQLVAFANGERQTPIAEYVGIIANRVSAFNGESAYLALAKDNRPTELEDKVRQHFPEGRRFSVGTVQPATAEEYAGIIERVGETKDVSIAQWLFPDGRMPMPQMKRMSYGMVRSHDGIFFLLNREKRPGMDASGVDLTGYIDTFAGGAMRLDLDNGGIEMTRKPSEVQMDAIYDICEAAYQKMEADDLDTFRVDISDDNGSTLFTLQYPRKTSARRIIDDIKNYYDSGLIPDNATGPEVERRGGTGAARFSIGQLYTGSAADYEKPSLLKVGTGEGSQVYGWGLYASDVRGVAESYASTDAENKRVERESAYITVDGEKWDSAHFMDNPQNVVAYAMEDAGGDKDKVISIIESYGDLSDDEKGMAVEYFEENRNKIEFTPAPKKTAVAEHVYEQTFFTNRAPGDESHLLKWYEPVSEEQAKWISDQISKEGLAKQIFNDYHHGEYDDPGTIGQSLSTKYDSVEDWLKSSTAAKIYEGLEMGLDSPQAASEFLARAGIDGIKYPVDSYGGKTVKDGDKAGWNYVSFRDDNIRVDHKWVDGHQRFSVAPQINTPEFKAWFGKSKVVDAEGKPLVVYHGTPNGRFNEFRKDMIGKATNRRGVDGPVVVGGLGFYFTNDKWYADGAGKEFNPVGERNPYTFEAYLSLQNPLIVEDTGWGSAVSQADARKGDLRRWAEEGGHDGIIVRSMDELDDNGVPDTVYIAFEPTQIKSATDNRGTFDPANPDIRYSIAARLNEEREAVEARLDWSNRDIRWSIGGSLGSLRAGRTRDFDAALGMLDRNYNPFYVWKKTGYWKGKDGQLRFEIPDGKMKDAETILKALKDGENSVLLSDIMDAPELFRAYPDLEKLKVHFDPEPSDSRHGFYSPSDDSITVNRFGLYDYPDLWAKRLQHEQRKIDDPAYLDRFISNSKALEVPVGTREEELAKAREKIGKINKDIEDYQRSDATRVASDPSREILIHEIQHAIQEREGFAKGMAGEVARKYAREILGSTNADDAWLTEARQNTEELIAAQAELKLRKYVRFGDVENAKPEEWSPEALKRLDRFTKDGSWQQYGDSWSTPRKSRSKKRQKLRHEQIIKAIKRMVDEEVMSRHPEYRDKTNAELEDVIREANKWSRDHFERVQDAKDKRELASKLATMSDYEIYLAFAGEVEARQAVARANMSDAEREETPPWESEDIPRSGQIVRYSVAASPTLREDVEAALLKRDAAHPDAIQRGRHDEIVFSENIPVFEFLGLPNLRVVTEVSKIRKLAIKHHLSVDQIVDIPNGYDNPVAIMSDDDGYVLLTDRQVTTDDGEQKPMRLFLRPTEWRSGEIVLLATAMAENGRDELEYYEPRIKAGLMFADENRIAGLNLGEETESILRIQASGENVKTAADFSTWRSTQESISKSGAGGNAAQRKFSIGSSPSEPLVRAMNRRTWRNPRAHGVDRDVRWSVGGTIDEAFPQLREMSDEELVIAAEAVRLALNTKGKGRFMNITRMQRDLRGLDPSQSHEDLGVRAVGVTQAARNLAKKMRADLDRGVSESKILAHLPDTMKEVFGSEMTARLRTGAKAGVYAERARKEIERRQEKVITDAVAIQSGVETKIMENAYGLDFSRTLMNLAENPYIRTDENGNRLPPERGEGEEGGAVDEQSSGSAAKPVETKVAEAVNEVARRAHELSEAEKAKKEEQRRQAGRDAENQLAFNQEENAAAEDSGEGGGAMFTGDEDLVDVATRKAGVNLADPRELALFVSELSRKYWNDTHGLGNKPDTWNDPVAMQFLRKTAANIYTKLVNDLVYSQARDTATRAINRFENVPTERGLVSEMTFVGQLIHAKRMADTQREMCNKLDAFLKEKFGTSGRFSPDKEELRRTVSAEMELRARYTRHVIWLTPDALNAEIEAMRKNLHGVEVEFDDAGRDVDQSKVMVETVRKLQILREFGGLVYKPLAQIQAAIEYWEDALRGDTDRIVRDNYERDLLTEKAAAKLAAAFDNPKLKTALEKNWKSLANDYIESHMGFFVLLRDLMRFAPDDVRAEAEPIIDYLELAVQKAGTRAMSGKRRHGDALAQAVQSIYRRDFQKVLAEFNQRDDRFLEFMGEVSPGKREIPTKGKAMQLFVSLLQVGHPVEVMDKDGGSHIEWVGGYHDNIVKNHREGQAEKIRRLLSVEDLNLIAWLGKWYEANRENLSTVAEALFGIGVYAETANYMPVKMLLDPQGLEKGNAVGWTIFPRSLTPRIRNERDFDTSADILSMFMSRMEESEQWAAHAKLGLELRGIFGRSVLRKSLLANHGKSADQLVQGFITDILSGRGAGDLTTGKFSFYADRIRGMAALGALGGNLGVTLKQTTSIPAFGFELGLAKTAKYILSAWSPDGFAAMREIFDSDERKNRWDVGNSEAVKNALSMNASGTLMKMLKASMITNKVGDVVPVLVVGQGIYRDALAQGMSREDAMARTWMLIERTQQSSRLENQPEFVRRSRAARALFQFLTTQVQYLGYEAKAIREVMAKPGDVRRWGSLGSTLVLNHFLLSSLYYWMGQLWKRLLGQEPPPDDELADWMVTCLLGPFGALYVAGFTATEALNVWVKGKKFGSQPTLPSLSWASNIFVRDPGSVLGAIFSHDKGTLDDVLSAAGKWLADFNATFRDLRKVYRYRVKKEPQRK